MMATASTDKTVKIWDIRTAEIGGDDVKSGADSSAGGGGPVCVETKSMGVGENYFVLTSTLMILTFLLAGEKMGKLHCGKQTESNNVSRRFRGRVRETRASSQSTGADAK